MVTTPCSEMGVKSINSPPVLESEAPLVSLAGEGVAVVVAALVLHTLQDILHTLCMKPSLRSHSPFTAQLGQFASSSAQPVSSPCAAMINGH